MENFFYKRVASWRIWQLKEQTSIEQIYIFAPKDTSLRSMILLRNKEKKSGQHKAKKPQCYLFHTLLKGYHLGSVVQNLIKANPGLQVNQE